MTFTKTTQIPATAENKKWFPVRFFKNFLPRVRKNAESCRSRPRIRGHLCYI